DAVAARMTDLPSRLAIRQKCAHGPDTQVRPNFIGVQTRCLSRLRLVRQWRIHRDHQWATHEGFGQVYKFRYPHHDPTMPDVDIVCVGSATLAYAVMRIALPAPGLLG